MDLKEIIELAEAAEQLQSKITLGEQIIKEEKTKLRHILEQTIPDMFTEVGISSVDLTSGDHVGMKQLFSVAMPAAGAIFKAKPADKKKLVQRLNGCIRWLRKHKGAALIKSQVMVEFNAGEDKIAKAIFAELRKRKLHPISSKTVHPQTLKAFLREKWNADVDIPVELFETYTGQVAEIALPKASAKSGK